METDWRIVLLVDGTLKVLSPFGKEEKVLSVLKGKNVIDVVIDRNSAYVLHFVWVCCKFIVDLRF